VGVEKLDLSKLVEKTLRWEALQTTFSIFLDILYPPNFRRLAKNGVFQHPRLVSATIARQSAIGVLPLQLAAISLNASRITSAP
jgi:hypothetical protein